jgi:hypothetical protein
LLAVVGAVAAREWFESALVVVLFAGTRLVDAYVTVRVHNLIAGAVTVTAPRATLVGGINIPADELALKQRFLLHR